MRRLSEDLRHRVVTFMLNGKTSRAASSHFQVSNSSARRWFILYSSDAAPILPQLGGDRSSRIKGDDALWLLSRLEAEPDATLEHFRALVLEHLGLDVSVSVIWRFFKKNGISFKKNATRRRTTSS